MLLEGNVLEAKQNLFSSVLKCEELFLSLRGNDPAIYDNYLLKRAH